MNIGVIVELNEQVSAKFAQVKEMGLASCQLVCWDETLFTPQMVQKVLKAQEESGIRITALWCGWGEPIVWNFYEGPITLGLVPQAYRAERIATLKRGSDFARRLGVENVVTHVGFLPENPYDPNYQNVLVAVREVVRYCGKNGQNFLFESGQETPVTLRRTIQDIGENNVGVNLDPANLLVYGKANPVDALDVLGKYVMGVHGKDGEYPTDGHSLGQEKPLGEGRVNYPRFIRKLRQIGYQGDITIEREISGEQQQKDIAAAQVLLQKLLDETAVEAI